MSTNGSPRPIKILLVEDNPGDIRLTQEALREGRIANELTIIKDGQSALDYLYRRGEYANAERPDFILLDLNLPRKNGNEVLRELKSDPDLHRIPVVILTSSEIDKDVINAYDHCANCYVVKPVGLDGFMKTVSQISDFWFMIVKLPKGDL